MSAVTAWFAIGNIILRFVSYEAITIFGRKYAQEPPITKPPTP